MSRFATSLFVTLCLTVSAYASELAVLRNGFSISHQRREQIGLTTRLYLTTDGKGYVDVFTSDIERFEEDLTPVPLPPASPAPTVPQAERPLDLKQLVATTSSQHQLDPDLVNSVIHAESAFNPRAVSPKGAQGLMQLMPSTASRLGVRNSFDPKANVDGGTRYLRELLELYNFDLIKALAAYNAGPHRVAQYRGVPPYRETQEYVRRIVLDFNRKKLAERKVQQAASRSSAKKLRDSRQKPPSTVKQAEVSPSTQQVPP